MHSRGPKLPPLRIISGFFVGLASDLVPKIPSRIDVNEDSFHQTVYSSQF